MLQNIFEFDLASEVIPIFRVDDFLRIVRKWDEVDDEYANALITAINKIGSLNELNLPVYATDHFRPLGVILNRSFVQCNNPACVNAKNMVEFVCNTDE